MFIAAVFCHFQTHLLQPETDGEGMEEVEQPQIEEIKEEHRVVDSSTRYGYYIIQG